MDGENKDCIYRCRGAGSSRPIKADIPDRPRQLGGSGLPSRPLVQEVSFDRSKADQFVREMDIAGVAVSRADQSGLVAPGVRKCCQSHVAGRCSRSRAGGTRRKLILILCTAAFAFVFQQPSFGVGFFNCVP